MLRAIRDHLRVSGPLTLDQIAGRFDMDEGAAEGALTLLMRRGDVAAEPLHEMCRGCAGACSGACGVSRILIYRAAGAAARDQSAAPPLNGRFGEARATRHRGRVPRRG